MSKRPNVRFNLLSVNRERLREALTMQMLASAGIVALTSMGCAGWWKLEHNRLEERAQILDAKQAELAQLDEVIGEIDAFTETKRTLESKLTVIDGLKKGRTGPVRALEDLTRGMPGRVWLQSVQEQKQRVAFQGFAMDHEDVAAFLKALQTSRFYEDVRLVYSRQRRSPGEDRPVYEFRVTCRVDYAA